jgi:hypothetical protein
MRCRTLLVKFLENAYLSELWLVEVLEGCSFEEVDLLIKELESTYGQYVRWPFLLSARKRFAVKKNT